MPQPHSTPLLSIGILILTVSFLFFNGGSAVRKSDTIDGLLSNVGLAIINTVLSGSSGFAVIIILHKHKTHLWSIAKGGNGLLSGLVAMAASAGYVMPWASIIIGALAALSYYHASMVLVHWKIDDAVDATGVHAAAGLVSLVISPLFYTRVGVFYEGVCFNLFCLLLHQACVTVLQYCVVVLMHCVN
eukprot:m.211207 g.211207  ORF g.211207 m.211207 type:complete len:188 (-) comp13785_c1_seq19:85-648(-)